MDNQESKDKTPLLLKIPSKPPSQKTSSDSTTIFHTNKLAFKPKSKASTPLNSSNDNTQQQVQEPPKKATQKDQKSLPKNGLTEQNLNKRAKENLNSPLNYMQLYTFLLSKQPNFLQYNNQSDSKSNTAQDTQMKEMASLLNMQNQKHTQQQYLFQQMLNNQGMNLQRSQSQQTYQELQSNQQKQFQQQFQNMQNMIIQNQQRVVNKESILLEQQQQQQIPFQQQMLLQKQQSEQSQKSLQQNLILKKSFSQNPQTTQQQQQQQLRGPGKKTKICNCKKTQCLKLYCDCFAVGELCGDLCKCTDCCNNIDNLQVRAQTIEHILEKNPYAFNSKDEVQDKKEKQSQKRGCNCRKSGCLKKYCCCYQAGEKCNENCQCTECSNVEYPLEGPTKRIFAESESGGIESFPVVSHHNHNHGVHKHINNNQGGTGQTEETNAPSLQNVSLNSNNSVDSDHEFVKKQSIESNSQNDESIKSQNNTLNLNKNTLVNNTTNNYNINNFNIFAQAQNQQQQQTVLQNPLSNFAELGKLGQNDLVMLLASFKNGQQQQQQFTNIQQQKQTTLEKN